MKEITEDYVSFEVAKLLKEKGFDEYCLFCYEQNVFSYTTNFTLEKALYRDILIGIKNSEFKENAIHNVFTAPSQSFVLKWLREVHKLHITILWDCGAYVGKNSFRYHIDRMDNYEDKGYNKIGFDSNEEAVEAAIKYCLENLI